MTEVWLQQGHQVTVIAGMHDLTKDEKYESCSGKLIKLEKGQRAIKVIRAYTPQSYNKNFLWRAWAYFTFVFFGFLGALIYARGRYDVVLASSPPLTVGPLGILIAAIKRCPFIFEIRDLWPYGVINTGVVKNALLIKLMYFMENIAYKKAAAINALTPAFKQVLTEKNNIPPEKIWMIPNAADLNVFVPREVDTALRTQLGWTDKFVGFYMGAHGRMNCLWQLIDTAEILRNEPEYLIVCIGSGIEHQSLVDKAKQQKLTNIQFLPGVNREQLQPYINSCDVSLIVLMKADIMKMVYPNKMFDSMSVAKPIILAIDGVARELVVNQAECGVYVEPENAAQIAEKMRFYRSNPEIAARHGQNGYKYVRENYDRSKLAVKYLQLIQDTVVNKSK